MCQFSVKKVIDAAIEMFHGDATAAIHWLYTPAKSLGGKTPISLLDTHDGVERVFDLIEQTATVSS